MYSFNICVFVSVVAAFTFAFIDLKLILSYLWNYKKHYDYRTNSELKWGSSARCHVTNGSQLCSFKNICYLPGSNQFLFKITEHSLLLGLTSKEDLKTIKLSSVLNHNMMSMKVAVVSHETIIPEISYFIDHPLFLLWRFKWDNIMHVFHDDIIPLFVTYLDICGDINICVKKFTLGFVDEGETGPYNELYSLFSNQQPLFLRKYNESVCFHEVHAGILSTSSWFQYGFGKKQGPVNPRVPIKIMHQFKEYIIQRYRISQRNLNNNTVVFFNRRLNRKILNIDYFTTMLHNTVQEIYPRHQPIVTEVDLASHDLSSILNILLTTKIVVGMHGSAMILCLFLPPGSVVVELFPFGIQPEHVSFIKSFSNIVGAGIIYRSWVNRNETNTFPHPEAPPLLGGLHHLSKDKQELILNTKMVPAVECCHNPMYLYRMFQDTQVCSDFKPVFKEALLEQKVFSKTSLTTAYMNNLFSSWYFPAPITNINCSLHQNILYASWQRPVNAIQSVFYDITLLLDTRDLLMKKSLDCQLKLELSYTVHFAEIWIKACSLDSESVDHYSQCLDIKR